MTMALPGRGSYGEKLASESGSALEHVAGRARNRIADTEVTKAKCDVQPLMPV